jgi:hypothetical protein
MGGAASHLVASLFAARFRVEINLAPLERERN